MQNKQIIPLIILILILIGSIYYWQKTKTQENLQQKSASDQSTIDISKKEPVVLSGNTIIESNSQISDGTVYLKEITTIRKPVNDNLTDLNEKFKYRTLFTDEEIGADIKQEKDLIQAAISQVKNLNIDSKFTEANNAQLESLDYLAKSLDALDKAFHATNQQEAQKQQDLYGYNLEQSNKVITNLQIPS